VIPFIFNDFPPRVRKDDDFVIFLFSSYDTKVLRRMNGRNLKMKKSVYSCLIGWGFAMVYIYIVSMFGVLIVA